MGSISHTILEQLKNKTATDWINALKKDGWVEEDSSGARRGFVKQAINGFGRRRIVIHFHPKKQFGPSLTKKLLEDTKWNEDDLIRLGMAKARKGRRRKKE